jgi:hypothetical protein
MSRAAVASYALRSGVCIAVASLLPALCAASPGAARAFAVPLFAPVMACVVLGPRHVGVSIRASVLVLKGWLAGAAVTALALALANSARSNATTYVCLVLLSLLILYPSGFDPLTQKMAMDCVIVALFAVRQSSAAHPGGGSGALFPFQLTLTTFMGVAAALLVSCALPWPGARGRAEAAAQLRQGEAAAAALVALQARAFAEGAGAPGAARLLAARAASLRAAAAAGLAAASALRDAAAWEEWLLRPGDAAASQRDAAPRRDTLADVLLATDGMTTALAAMRAAEAQHARGAARAAARAPHAGAADACAAEEASDAADGDLGRLNRLLGPHVAALGAAAGAALQALQAPGDERAAALRTLRGCEAGLAAALQGARSAIYYAPAPPSLAAATAAADGPPVEHYAYLLCLGRVAARLLQAAAAADALAAAPPAPAPACPSPRALARQLLTDLFGPYAQRPQPARVRYALKLVTAVVIASLLGVASSGSGLWAAITAQIVGARSSVYVGGSLQTASARLSGTLLGAMFGYLTMALCGAAPLRGAAPLGASLALLSCWCAGAAAVRVSPRNAYAALVAQFVPFIIVLGTTGAADAAQSAQQYAYARIEQNLIGILVFIVVELAVLPARASALLQPALAATLRAAAAAASAAWAPVLRGRSSGAGVGDAPRECAACAAGRGAAAAAALAACMKTHSALLAEALEEPPWLAPHHAAALTGTPLQRPLSALVQAQLERLSTLLALMRVAADGVAAGPASGEHGAHFAPLQPALAALRNALRALFAALAADLDSGTNGRRTHAAGAALDAALHAFEACYGAQLLALRVAHMAAAAAAAPALLPPPPVELVLPLDALIFCTRELSGTVDAIAGAVREYLQDGAELIAHAAARGVAAEEGAELLPRGGGARASQGEETLLAEEACACGAPLEPDQAPASVQRVRLL